VVAHNQKKASSKEEKKKPFISPEDSDKYSWLQSRTTKLILAKCPDGNSFTEAEWSECYKQAKEEWDEKKANT
jgi:hypothetical protein